MPSYFDALTDVAYRPQGDRDRIAVEMPFEGTILGYLPACDDTDIRRAVSQARQAQRQWHALPVSRRSDIVLRLHDLLLAHQNEVLDLIQIDAGKSRRDALEEVLDVANVARYYALRAPGWLAPMHRRGVAPLLTRVVEEQRPYGVVGLITPWNYPFTLALSDAIPALLAGNAVVLKPAEDAMLSALRGALLLQEAGLPEHIFRIVTGRGTVAGRALVDVADAVCFTGSTEVGVEIAERTGRRLIPSSLELGGKNSLIVLEDAALADAVEGAVGGAFSNAGQLCVAIERIYVHASVYEPFLHDFVNRTRALTIGPRFDFSADIGSLISDAQLRKTVQHVQDAIAHGATLEIGGRERPDLGPYFYEPTVLTNVPPAAMAYEAETFGPVVSVEPFDEVDDVIGRVNQSPYGLNASVWTGTPSRGLEVARRLEVGTVGINDVYASTWGSVDAPMGGMKQSGLGRRHGRQGFFRFVESQTIAVQRGPSPAARFGSDAELYRRVLTTALRWVRRVPFAG